MPDTTLVLLIPSLETGGTERQVVLLARGIVELDPALATRTLLVTLRSGGALERDLPPGLRTTSLDLRHRMSPTALWRLVRLVRRERPTVVYSFLVPANLLCAAASFMFRTRWIWGHRSQHYSMGASARTHQIVATLLRLGAHRCHGIIVNSEAAGGYLRTIGVRSIPICVVRNAIDPADFGIDDAARRFARAELGIGVSDELLVSVGRLVADKDHPTLLRAFAAIVAERPHARLVLVGGGTENVVTELRQLASELHVDQRFTLLGARHDMNRWYNAADVLVQSSTNEGQSNVLIEAAATGCPTVSTDCGDAVRILPPENVAPVQDPRALADAVIGVLANRPATRSPAALGATIRDLAMETLVFLGLKTETDRSTSPAHHEHNGGS